jgi:glycosyltransferase involved in cell wall biosynthesis
MTERRTLLHVFSTFNVGGPQIRFAQLANHFGLSYRHLIVSMDGGSQAMDRLLPELDAAMLPIAIRKGKTLRNIPPFRRMLRGVKPDLLVTSNWGSIDWAMANFDHKFPHLHMEDGFGPEEVEHQLPRRVWMRRLVLSRSTVMLPSRKLFALARDVWKLPERRLLYVPNGVDCARFLVAGDPELAARHGIRQDIPVIGAVGGLRAEKNLLRLVESFERVAARRPVQLVLVGDGPLCGPLREAVEARGLSGAVVFTGASPYPERLLPFFSVFALSSDTEQMPLSILEAMAAGRPVAATDVGDVRDMVAEENRPFVVPRDAGSLGEAILRLLADTKEAEEIGRANRERAIAVYDQSRMFDAYRRLFDGDLAMKTVTP